MQHFVWPGINFSWQAQYFRDIDRKNRKTHWHEAVSSALNFPFLKEVPQNCFVFAVVNLQSWVWKNCFVFDVATFKTWRSLAELLCFWRCRVQTLRKSRRIPAFWTTTPPRNTTLQLQLRYTTLHPAVVVRWPLQPLRKNNSNHLSVHQWIRSAIRDSQQPTSPIGFLFLKLPPPPCAVLLVEKQIDIYIYK